MDFDIVYHIDTPQQFWSELEDLLHIHPSESLSRIDGMLRRYIYLCATYHEKFLQDPMQLTHACTLLLNSEIFDSHSSRLSSLLQDDTSTTTDPHKQLILLTMLLSYGQRSPSFMRSQKKWRDVIPMVMDHLLVEVDPAHEDWSSPNHSHPASRGGVGVPIETKLRQLSVDVLYQICRVQKFTIADLQIFIDPFISTLFDLVEQTRDMEDDTLNYSIIKLIVALNEQFMVAALPSPSKPHHTHTRSTSNTTDDGNENRVLLVLMRRLHYSKTFGENIIFMLNRSCPSAHSSHHHKTKTDDDDLCLQLLILKILYLLFTTPGTQSYFYTNDLRVLIDVFLRALADLGDEFDSLRHTYLRVLSPLLNIQREREGGREVYKASQVVRTLHSLVSRPDMRFVSPTTKRLVERCLKGSWVPKDLLNGHGDGGWSPTSSGSGSGSFEIGRLSISGDVGGRRGSEAVVASATGSCALGRPGTGSGASSPISPTHGHGPKPKLQQLKTSRSISDLRQKSASVSTPAPPPPLPSSLADRRKTTSGLGLGLGHGGSALRESATASLISLSASIVPNTNTNGHRPPRRTGSDPNTPNETGITILATTGEVKKRRKPPPVPVRANGKGLAGRGVGGGGMVVRG